MLAQVEGSRAVAQAVAACRPQVICAYPISPQTHIVEELSRMVKSGHLTCEYVNVESEMAAMSGVIGASAVGARTYTATASQGLLFMAEAVYNASGMGLPVVMTVANRAIGAPINIWNDHSDSMSQRDCGWVQLYAASNQEAADLHVLAFRLAEQVSLPVMVCMDGFVLTHATEQLDVPEPAQVDTYLPPFSPRQVLDPDAPVSIGAMVGPEAFTEVRHLAQLRFDDVLTVLPRLTAELSHVLGRATPGLLDAHACEDARTVLLGLGSVMGTALDIVDAARAQGRPVGAVTLTSFRPFPYDEVCRVLGHVERVVVLERALAPGAGGIVTADVRQALAGTGVRLHTVVAGLGGRPVTSSSLDGLLRRAETAELEPTTVLDLDLAVVARERGRVS